MGGGSSTSASESGRISKFLASLAKEELINSDSASCKHMYCEIWGSVFHCGDCNSSIYDEAIIAEETHCIESIVDNSTPEDGVNRGVTIQFLVDFTNACNCWDMTTREVRRKFIMPVTRASRCRFVELPEMVKFVGKATTFISHTWGAKFGDLVGALCDGNADRNRLVWVDIFAVRQWPSQRPDLDFSAVVRQCKSFVIVCSSHYEIEKLLCSSSLDKPSQIMSLPANLRAQVAFLRVWCLVEFHTAVLSGCAIVIKGGRYKRCGLDICLEADVGFLKSLAWYVDIECAEATVAADKERILNGIDSVGGIAALNEMIRGLLLGTLSFQQSWVQCAACGDKLAIEAVMRDTPKYILSVAGCGYVELLNTMILSGADVNGSQGNIKNRPLMAASEGGHQACVDLLLKSGADVAASCNHGWTALLLSSKYGHTGCVELLLRNGSDVAVRDKKGMTALMYAAEYGHVACVELLIAAGSDVTALDLKGMNALMHASVYGTACVQLLRRYDKK